MAELTPTERLQPCLLDRLTDDEPGKQSEGRDKRVFSTRQMRQAVLRDLQWLLNTPQRIGPDEEADHPNVFTSAVNYGVPDLCGLTSGNLDVLGLERAVTRAVKSFEPRIRPQTLRITVINDPEEMSDNGLAFDVRGELWAQPVPEPLYLKTAVDLDTGQFNIEDQSRV